MSEPHERLKEARSKSFEEAADAARSMGVNLQTYYAHENGRRGFRAPSALKYATKFRVNVDWLLYNRGPRDRAASPLDGIDDLPPEGQELVAEYIEMLRLKYQRRRA
jgi:DNA-binding XRE family transcriptional regulator